MKLIFPFKYLHISREAARWPFGGTICLLLTAASLAVGVHAQAQSVVTLREMNRKFSMTSMVQPGAPDRNMEKLLGGLEEAMIDQLLNERKWRWQVAGDIGWYYTSNVFQTQNEVSDQVIRPGAGLFVYYGDTQSPLDVEAQYASFYNDYLNKTVPNGFDQNASISAGWRPAEKLSFKTAIIVSDTKSNNIDAGAQTRVVETNWSFGTRYQTGEKTAIGSDTSYDARRYENYGTFSDINDYLYTDYQFTPKLRLGVAAGGGARSLAGTSETDMGARFRLNYEPTEKFLVNGLFGWENRSISTGRNKGCPRIELGSQYRLSERTQFQISVYERISSNLGLAAVEIDQVEGITASVAQQLYNKIILNMGGGFEYQKPESNAGSPISGNLQTAYVQGSVTWNFLNYSALSIYRTYLNRHSTSITIGQPSDQVMTGLELIISY